MPSGVYKRKPMSDAVRKKISRTLKSRRTANRTGRAVYPWNKWFGRNRRTFIVWKTEDYTCTSSMMERSIRNEASKRGISVSVWKYQDCVEVLIHKDGK